MALTLDAKIPPTKLLRKISNRKGSISTSLCPVEGWKCFQEASERVTPEAILIKKSVKSKFDNLHHKKNHKVYEFDDPIFDSMAHGTTPEGIIGIFKRPQIKQQFPKPLRGSLHLVLFQWRDPNNVGSVIRSARGFGIHSITLWGHGPDFFSPKVIRSSMGSVFHIPLHQVHDSVTLSQEWNSFCGHAGAPPISDIDFNSSNPNVLVIGSESHGIPDHLLQSSTTVGIPLKNNLESLSAPIASSILMHQLSSFSSKSIQKQ